MNEIKTREGFISFRDYKIWYREVGPAADASKIPLLCLHGGPGAPHDYLELLEQIAASGGRVIFYDQLGCGNSDQPHDPSLWTIPLFLEELGVVRQALGLDRVHILGQSWGGMLAMEYALTQPEGLISLILADTVADMHEWISEVNRLRAELPEAVQATLAKHEDTNTTDDPEYEEAMMEFYGRFVYRQDPWPDCLLRTMEKVQQNPEVYATMWGPSEFFVTGILKDWSVSDRLGEISVPTLVVGGRYDEATPRLAEAVHRGISGSELVIFENSAHMPHLEETERYIQVLTKFLEGVESQASLTEREVG